MTLSSATLVHLVEHLSADNVTIKLTFHSPDLSEAIYLEFFIYLIGA